MYPRSKFQEVLLAIREEMAREADFDVDLFAEMVRSGVKRAGRARFSISETTETRNTTSSWPKATRAKSIT